MKDYYSILRVSRSADIQTIKRSYRLLVQKYHPDINPDPQAAELIKDINEAYDVLSDAIKKNEYDFRFINPAQQQPISQPAAHRDPRYRRSGRPVKKENRQQELIKAYVHLAVKVCWAGSFVCFFLLLDFFLPHQIINDSVRSVRANSSGRSISYVMVSESGQRIKIGFKDFAQVEQGEQIQITQAAITAIVIRIDIPQKSHSITQMATLYSTYFFVPILLLITCVSGFLLRNSVELQFNMGIVTFVLLIFTLILIFK